MIHIAQNSTQNKNSMPIPIYIRVAHFLVDEGGGEQAFIDMPFKWCFAGVLMMVKY